MRALSLLSFTVGYLLLSLFDPTVALLPAFACFLCGSGALVAQHAERAAARA